MASQKVKVELLAPTVGHKAHDVIEVGAAEAEALVANRSAVPVREKSVKD